MSSVLPTIVISPKTLSQHRVYLITDQVFIQVIVFFGDMHPKCLSYNPGRDMLKAFVAESIASQHSVFKSNFQFSIADYSAARLSEKYIIINLAF